MSSCVLAEAFPELTIRGFDYHEPSVVIATDLATTKGLSDRETALRVFFIYFIYFRNVPWRYAKYKFC